MYPTKILDEHHGPLKICYDQQVFTAQRWGGVSRYFAELARELGRTQIVSIHAPIHVSEYLATLRPGIASGIRLPIFPGVTVLANAIARGSRSRAECDIYHPTWYNSIGWRPRKARVAYTVFDMIAERFGAENPAFSRQAAAKKRAVAEADLIFCISRSARDDLVQILDVNPDKIVVSYLGSNIHLLAAQTLPIAYPYILYVGQRGGYKNFQALASAFKSSTRLRSEFGIVCFGGGEFTSLELEMLGDMVGSGRGTLLHVEGNDELLAGAYRQAAVFVCPSRYEGFGLPVLEAMSCACPVITTKLSSLPEVGGEAVAYAPDSGADAIRQTLEGMLFDDKIVQLARQKGLDQARKFSWESTASVTLTAYRSLRG